jgi:hypothetical protein
MTRFVVDPWDPAYGPSIAGTALEESDAPLNAEIELPDARWAPIAPSPAEVSQPSEVLLVDGVRRVDARVWFSDGDRAVQPGLGLAASWAAGVVRMNGTAHITHAQVRHGVLTSYVNASDVRTALAAYPAYLSGGTTADVLSITLQNRLSDLEAAVAGTVRTEDDLLLVDGSLKRLSGLPRAIGYVKTHHRSYLPDRLNAVVEALAPGERTPVFRVGAEWSRHSWYVRLPFGSTAPWSGIVRCECSDTLRLGPTMRLADTVTVILQRLASRPYKDPRAPQNLVPTGGLEKHLRHRLGDPIKLHRSLVAASRSWS